MFTGIVEELGTLRERAGTTMTFAATLVLEDAKVGGSIAVNGCCLTVIEVGEGWWAAEVVDETLARTNLGGLRPGESVNLERPVRATGRLGGHVVQGHVDTAGQIVSPAPALRVKIPAALSRYVVEKGSVTVDGCSLTVVDALDDGFTVAIVPHTAAATTLGRKGIGEQVNVEVDLIAKYVERLLDARDHR